MLSGSLVVDHKLLRILLVEDDEDIRRDLGDFLRDEGYDVEVASNGQEALELLKHEKLPRVILLDLMMPIMDGIEFRSQQLRHKKFSGIPVVILSGGTDGRKRAALLGADAFIAKPLNLVTLVETIERYH